jgi:hypothetical protein
MKRNELHVEHYHGNRFLKARRFGSEKRFIVFGSSAAADIRLVGDDVNGVDALVVQRSSISADTRFNLHQQKPTTNFLTVLILRGALKAPQLLIHGFIKL